MVGWVLTVSSLVQWGRLSMRRIAVSAVLSAACLTIVGCAPSPAPAKAEAEASAPAEAETPAPFVAGEGEPQIWEPLAEDDPAMAALAVVKFDDLPSLSNISAVRGFVTMSPAK